MPEITEANGRWTSAFTSSVVWTSVLIYFSFVMGLYGVSFWLPQIIQNNFKAAHTATGWLSAIPWACAAAGMLLFGRSSDKRGDRKWHLVIASFVGMTAFLIAGMESSGPYTILAALCVATTAVMCLVSTFWSVPTSLLSGTAAAAGLAWINSVANLGGFLSPEMFAWLRTDYGLGAGLQATGIFIGAGGISVLLLQRLTGKKI
jgi:predicted MFS family arabinose efflux permease